MTLGYAFLRTTIQTRSKEHTATGVVCYRFGLAAASTIPGKDGTNRVFDYTRRSGIIATGWAAPAGTDTSWSDPITWAHRIEAVDKRKNSRQCRDDVVGIPIELVEVGLAEQAIQVYADRLAALHRTVIQWACHGPDRGGKNHHVHVVYPGRHVVGLGFSKHRDREQDNPKDRGAPDLTSVHKGIWSEICGGYGIELRWSSETPGHHLGPKICATKRRRLVAETRDEIRETILASQTGEAVPGQRVLDDVAVIATGINGGLTVSEMLQVELQRAQHGSLAPRPVAASVPHQPEVLPYTTAEPQVLPPVTKTPPVLPPVRRTPEVLPPVRGFEVLPPVRRTPEVLPPVRGLEVLPPVRRTPEVLPPVRGLEVLPPVRRTPEVLPPVRGLEVLPPVRRTPEVLPVRGLEVLPPVRRTLEVLPPVRGLEVLPPVRRTPEVLPPVRGLEVLPPVRRTPEVLPPVRGLEVLPPVRRTPEVLPPVRGLEVLPPVRRTPEVLPPVRGLEVLPPVRRTPEVLPPVRKELQIPPFRFTEPERKPDDPLVEIVHLAKSEWRNESSTTWLAVEHELGERHDTPTGQRARTAARRLAMDARRWENIPPPPAAEPSKIKKLAEWLLACARYFLEGLGMKPKAKRVQAGSGVASVAQKPPQESRAEDTSLPAQPIAPVYAVLLQSASALIELHALPHEGPKLKVSTGSFADLKEMLDDDDDEVDELGRAALERLEKQHEHDVEERDKAEWQLHSRAIELAVSVERRRLEQEAKSEWRWPGKRAAVEVDADRRQAIARDVIRDTLPRIKYAIRSVCRRVLELNRVPSAVPARGVRRDGEQVRTRGRGNLTY